MIYCVSDIHGDFGLFLKLLDKIRLSNSDTLIICGDIIDKGQDSARLLKYILEMPNARAIIGNHEYTFLKYYWGLMRYSPDDFGEVLQKLREYFPYEGYLLDWETVDRLENLPFYIEEDDFICVHAGVPLDGNGKILPLESATREQLVYDRNFKSPEVAVKDGKCVLFGHTPTSYISGKDEIIGYLRPDAKMGADGRYKITDYYKIHLDTGTWLNGVLGCFCIDTCTAVYVKK